jgi:hypothetical protein
MMTAQQMINKYRLSGRQWIHKGYHGTLFYHASVTRVGMEELQKYFGDSCELIVDYFQGEQGNWHYYYPDMVRLRDSFLNKVHKNPKVLPKLLNDWEGTLRDFDKIAKLVNSANLSALNNKQLLKLYQLEETAYIREFSISITLQDAFSMTAEDFLLPLLNKALAERGFKNNNHKYIELLTSPVTASFSLKEHWDRMRLRLNIENIHSPSPKDLRLLKKHSQKYEWLNNNYSLVHHLDANYFLKQLENVSKWQALREIHKATKKFALVKKQKKFLIKKLKFGEQLRTLLKITEIFAYMQDERKKYSLKTCGLQHKFLMEFAKRLKISTEEAKWIWSKEIGQWLLENKGSSE